MPLQWTSEEWGLAGSVIVSVLLVGAMMWFTRDE
jgi:hypothetical protein